MLKTTALKHRNFNLNRKFKTSLETKASKHATQINQSSVSKRKLLTAMRALQSSRHTGTFRVARVVASTVGIHSVLYTLM